MHAEEELAPCEVVEYVPNPQGIHPWLRGGPTTDDHSPGRPEKEVSKRSRPLTMKCEKLLMSDERLDGLDDEMILRQQLSMPVHWTCALEEIRLNNNHCIYIESHTNRCYDNKRRL